MIGPPAADKSSLARIIADTATPSAGNVQFGGADLVVWVDAGGARYLPLDGADLAVWLDAGGAFYLPQEIELFSGTLKENIARLGDTDLAVWLDAGGARHLPEDTELFTTRGP